MKIRIKETDAPVMGTVDKEFGYKTTVSDFNPESGRLTWDVEYEVDPQILYNKLDELIDFMKKAPEGTELGKIRNVIKTLKNKTHRLITQSK